MESSKSHDEGKTWKNVGLKRLPIILGRIVLHTYRYVWSLTWPGDRHLWGANGERRTLFKPKDGGKTLWDRLIYVNERYRCTPKLAMGSKVILTFYMPATYKRTKNSLRIWWRWTGKRTTQSPNAAAKLWNEVTNGLRRRLWKNRNFYLSKKSRRWSISCFWTRLPQYNASTAYQERKKLDYSKQRQGWKLGMEWATGTQDAM